MRRLYSLWEVFVTVIKLCLWCEVLVSFLLHSYMVICGVAFKTKDVRVAHNIVTEMLVFNHYSCLHWLDPSDFLVFRCIIATVTLI